MSIGSRPAPSADGDDTVATGELPLVDADGADLPLADMPVPPAPTGRSRPTVVYDDQARKPRRKGPAPRVVEVRRVRRVLRRIDTWSVFRFAVALYLCGLVVLLTTGVGLWLLASGAGAIPNIEHFITQLFALKRFTFKPRQLFLGLLGVGAVWVFVATLLTVLTTVLFNLISDVVGGIELTILEEEPLDGPRAGTTGAGAPSAGGRRRARPPA